MGEPKEQLQTPSALAELHVYVVPSEYWVVRRKLVRTQVTDEAISHGFVRVSALTHLRSLRREIEEQLEWETLPTYYTFLRIVGRNFAQVKPKQEPQLRVKDFMPPYAPEPEIYLLELPTTFFASLSPATDSGVSEIISEGSKDGKHAHFRESGYSPTGSLVYPAVYRRRFLPLLQSTKSHHLSIPSVVANDNSLTQRLPPVRLPRSAPTLRTKARLGARKVNRSVEPSARGNTDDKQLVLPKIETGSMLQQMPPEASDPVSDKKAASEINKSGGKKKTTVVANVLKPKATSVRPQIVVRPTSHAYRKRKPPAVPIKPLSPATKSALRRKRHARCFGHDHSSDNKERLPLKNHRFRRRTNEEYKKAELIKKEEEVEKEEDEEEEVEIIITRSALKKLRNANYFGEEIDRFLLAAVQQTEDNTLVMNVAEVQRDEVVNAEPVQSNGPKETESLIQKTSRKARHENCFIEEGDNTASEKSAAESEKSAAESEKSAAKQSANSSIEEKLTETEEKSAPPVKEVRDTARSVLGKGTNRLPSISENPPQQPKAESIKKPLRKPRVKQASAAKAENDSSKNAGIAARPTRLRRKPPEAVVVGRVKQPDMWVIDKVRIEEMYEIKRLQQQQLSRQARSLERNRRSVMPKSKTEVLDKQDSRSILNASPITVTDVSIRTLEGNPDLATTDSKLERRLLTLELKRQHFERVEAERVRDNTVLRLTQLSQRLNRMREQMNEIWKQRYIQELKQTAVLQKYKHRIEDEIENLRMNSSFALEENSPVGQRHLSDWGPSNKNNYRMRVARLEREIEYLVNRVESAKLKLSAETKLRTLIEQELRWLRSEMIVGKPTHGFSLWNTTRSLINSEFRLASV